MLLSIDANVPQAIFPNFNPVELDEIEIGLPQYGDYIITDDMPAESTQITPRKRGKMSREGWEAWEMTSEELQQLNSKWVYWANQLEHTIRWYAWGDEDLTQIGIINLRKTLCEDINAPPNYLLHRAKFAIWMADSYGKSVDSRKSENINRRTRKGGIKVIYTDGYNSRNPYDNPLLADLINYPPDVMAIDQIAYEDFRADLTVEEEKLLDFMIETKDDGKKGTGRYKKMFIRQTSSTYSNYEAVHMSLLQKFYHHYGTSKQREDFENFYLNWRPRTPMYHGRSRKRTV